MAAAARSQTTEVALDRRKAAAPILGRPPMAATTAWRNHHIARRTANRRRHERHHVGADSRTANQCHSACAGDHGGHVARAAMALVLGLARMAATSLQLIGLENILKVPG